MPLISLDDDDPRWVPTHVNVTVIRARGLRTKGKQGSRYVYTVIQVGKEKYTTGLVEKAVEPEWNEECSFELLPGLLEDPAAPVGAYPPGSSDLVLTVMHRVLIGLDVFLGQAVVPLDKAFREGVCPRNEWLKLHSKAGRKVKERGELQVTVQFTRNNMTASMYDLTVKDKPRSTFGKLKDRVTGKKRGDVESSSAILPGRYAALSSSAGQSLQENGSGGSPGMEECGDERRSKVKDFFLKGKLRKNSDTRSCSSLASESSMASSAGDPFVPIELCSTPIYSSKVMEPFRADSEGGVKVMTHKRAYSDEASKVTALRPCPAVENLQGQNTLLSKSTLCINGSHIYSSEPACSKGPGGVPVKRSLLEKCSPLSRSLQNLTRRSEDPQKAEGRRWSIDKSKKEGESEGSVAQDQGAATSEGKPIQATAPLVVAAGGTEGSDKGKKLRKTLFSSGRSDSLPAKPEQAAAPQERRSRGWFSSSDAQNKPSPHPVKPLTNTAAQGEKKSEGRSVLEKLRSSIHPGRSSQQSTAEPEKAQVYMSEARAHYQTLTNMELIALLLQQEVDAEQQREESELQATLLEKREAELKKLKVQVRDLEDYIDKLLVRIMEQTPTLLQVRGRPK
ncbi:rab11 family-interacting protein 5 isoform X2 [Pygocentrus nattereri]|uniref:C2 domain-containing protein n=1 Tax=Pygocentrus nattereri TaxID=42514 RepID=A0A3B4EFF1_PYGNA|nr:rab11 family-interacting protein 5 isoform X2 [Pygocentrus nattereri]